VTIEAACSCETTVRAPDEDAFPDAFLVHVRAEHADWPFPDLAVRIVGEALLRLTGGTERLDDIGELAVHPVTADRIDDWLAYFDHDAFVDKPWVAGCYCIEQHAPLAPPALGAWQDNRTRMVELLTDGKAFGYLAYADGRPAGWVNASVRAHQVYALGKPDDTETVTVSCFNIAPPYRGHRLAGALLDRVIADAPQRGARRVEAYPRTAGDGDTGRFRGPMSLYEARGFEVVKDLGWSTLVRLTL
jgi:GNAT superfamily N-acetyltransferase